MDVHSGKLSLNHHLFSVISYENFPCMKKCGGWVGVAPFIIISSFCWIYVISSNHNSLRVCVCVFFFFGSICTYVFIYQEQREVV